MSLVRVLVCVCVLSGCLKPELQSCGDLLCPADSVCLPSGQCATRESIDACVDHLEGAACATSFFTGACTGGICTAPRCGDGIVSGSEQCDGSVSGVDCVDYGFDTGIPTCSALCGFDVVGSCVKFGWKRVLTQSASRAWTNGDLFAIITVDGKRLELYRDNVLLASSVAPDFEAFYSLAGAGTTVVANAYSTILRSDSGGPFVALPTAGLPATDSVVEVGDDGTVYVGSFFADHFEIFKSNAAGFQQILTAPTRGSGIKIVGGALYVFFADGTVRRYAAGTWSPTLFTATADVVDLAERDGVLYVVVRNIGAFQFANGTLTPISLDTFDAVDALPSGIYFGAGDSTVMRLKDGQQQSFNAPIYGSLISDGADLYAYGSGIYRYSGVSWAVHPGIGQPATDIALLANGSIGVTTVFEIFTDAGSNNGWYYNQASEPSIAIAGRGPTDFFVTGGTRIEHFDGQLFRDVTLPAGVPAISDLAWDAPTSTLYAVGMSGLGMKLVAATWTQLATIAGCDLYAITLRGSNVYATGACGTEGVVWALAGTSWTELHRTTAPLHSIEADGADNLYANGPQGGILRVAGTWRDEPRAAGASISATSPDDIWIGGGPDDVIHWDGKVWSRVAVVGPANPHLLATPSTVYVGGAKDTMLLR